MSRTSAGLLAVAFVVGGLLGGFGLAATYSSLPSLPVSSAVAVGIFAVLVAFLAWTTHNRVTGQRGARPPEPLQMARYAALARACSPAGAVVGGLWAGALGYLLSLRGSVAAVGHDRPVAILGLVTAVLLVAAGLWLEHVCAVKPPDDGPRR